MFMESAPVLFIFPNLLDYWNAPRSKGGCVEMCLTDLKDLHLAEFLIHSSPFLCSLLIVENFSGGKS